jgi:hypothetical protein
MNAMRGHGWGRWRPRLALVGALLLWSGSAGAADFDVGLSAYAAGDYATALKEWSELARQGNPEAQYSLGELYEQGRGVAKDEAKAAEWFAAAAEQGHMRAQAKYAGMLAAGRGVARDPAAAVLWWTKAAEQGSAASQVRLAEAYRKGDGVHQDLAKAEALYLEAAEAGDGAARVELFEVRQEIEREAAARAEASLAPAEPQGEPAASETSTASAGEPKDIVPAGSADGQGGATAEVASGAGQPAPAEPVTSHVEAAPADTGAPAEAGAEHAAAPGEPEPEAGTVASDPDDGHEVATEPAPDDPFATLIATKQAVVLSLSGAPAEAAHGAPPAATEPAAATSDHHAQPEEPIADEPPETAVEAPAAEPEPASPAPTETSAEAPDASLPATFRVWLASYEAAAQAEAGWQDLVLRHGDLLAALTPTIVPPDEGAVEGLFRLQAGPFASAVAAQDVCRALGERDADCVAVAP